MKQYYNQYLINLESLFDSIRLQSIPSADSGRKFLNKFALKAKNNLHHGWNMVKQHSNRTVFQVNMNVEKSIKKISQTIEPGTSSYFHIMKDLFDKPEADNTKAVQISPETEIDPRFWWEKLYQKISVLPKYKLKVLYKIEDLVQSFNSFIFRLKILSRVQLHRINNLIYGQSIIYQNPLLIPFELSEQTSDADKYVQINLSNKHNLMLAITRMINSSKCPKHLLIKAFRKIARFSDNHFGVKVYKERVKNKGRLNYNELQLVSGQSANSPPILISF